MIPRYQLHVFWSEPDDCWIANVPDLHYCSAHGVSAQEAVAEVQIAIELFVESLIEHGDPVPQPRYWPAIEGDAKAA